MKYVPWFAALFLMLMSPLPSQAADGYVTGNVNLRTGPDIGYPVIRNVRAGAPISIQGCLDDWSWCDVVTHNDRGWVAGNFIEYEYQSRRVRVPEYGIRLGLPIITFSFGSYWDNHYRGRSWYRDRDRWSHWKHDPGPSHGHHRSGQDDHDHDDDRDHDRGRDRDRDRDDNRGRDRDKKDDHRDH